MSQPHPKKRRKPGGSFCAMGGCTNRSTRETVSGHPHRDFLRYIYFPTNPKHRQQWLTRMKRDTSTWTPGPHTRVCSDHFFECDFVEEDLIRYRSRISSDDNVAACNKRTRIRIKPNSLPNTDRLTGSFADPFVTREWQRGPPRERCPEIQVTENSPTSRYSAPLSSPQQDLQLRDPMPDSEAISPQTFAGNGTEGNINDDSADDDYEMSSENGRELIVSGSNGCDLADDTSNGEPISHERFHTFAQNVSVPLLFSLFNLCPECGMRTKVMKIVSHGFVTVLHHRCYGICSPEGVFNRGPPPRQGVKVFLLQCVL